MKRAIVVAILMSTNTWMLGCSAKATDDQINKMCQNWLEITGVLRGTSDEAEVAKLDEEFSFKEKQLKEEMDRDLQGLDDVLAQRLAELEKQQIEPPKDEEQEKTPEEPVKTPEELKEDRKNAVKADIEKKKKAIRDQFEPMIEKLGPQKEIRINKAKEYTSERRAEADEALEKCLAKTKKEAVTEEVATCRAAADRKEHYNACR